MRLIGKKHLEKIKRKNRGNKSLLKEINKLVEEIEHNDWTNHFALINKRKDADRVHNDGFYFFDILQFRVMLLIEYEEDGEATVVWAGNHKAYESTFKNNKDTIKNWLKSNNWI
jgi:ribosomal 30S subunit maturation factor RimM